MTEPKPTNAFSGEVPVVAEISEQLGTIYALRKKLVFKDGVLIRIDRGDKQEICKTAQRR